MQDKSDKQDKNEKLSLVCDLGLQTSSKTNFRNFFYSLFLAKGNVTYQTIGTGL